MKLVEQFLLNTAASLTNEKERLRLQFIWIYRIMSVVATVMTVINIVTDKRSLMFSTLSFAICCIVNVILTKFGHMGLKISIVLFVPEILLLFSFFIVTGIPEGFSVIWICLLPTCGLFVFGRKRGSAICAAMFLILLFFFHTKIGLSLLQFPYTESFKLRFPFLYTAFYVVSFFLEYVRSTLQSELIKAQNEYRYLYSHDALTNIYNRYGFNERLNSRLTDPYPDGLTLMIIDIDHFKRVNDQYGHLKGDEVLCHAAKELVRSVGSEGEVCRWGGEEFAVMLSSSKKSHESAQRIHDDFSRMETRCGDDTVKITVSIGAAIADSDSSVTAGALLNLADICLYRAKEEGRDRIVCERYRENTLAGQING